MAFVGACYLFHRYRSQSDPKEFFRSPHFRAIAGSIAMFILAFVIVSQMPPAMVEGKHDEVVFSEQEQNFNEDLLISGGPRFNYELIQKVYADRESEEGKSRYGRLMYTYSSMRWDPVRKVRNVSNFGFAVIKLKEGYVAQVRSYLDSIRLEPFPYKHYCLGKAFLIERNDSLAGLEFEKEMLVDDGNHDGAFVELLDIYRDDVTNDRLYKLVLREGLASKHVHPSLGRAASFSEGDVAAYFRWMLRTLTSNVNSVGFLAAIFISCIWLTYVNKLEKEPSSRYLAIAFFFLGGSIFSFLVFPISDAVEFFTGWELDGSFFNDFVYAVVMIGGPEEFVKIIPLLVIAATGNTLRPVEYIICGCASALGFAFVENLMYFESIDGGIIHGRAYLSAIGHMVDTSIVAYGFVLAKYKHQGRKGTVRFVLKTYLLGCLAHGIFDLLLFQGLILMFFVFFILLVQFWIIMINNSINNSPEFSYSAARYFEKSKGFLTLSLMGIFTFEYLMLGFNYGSSTANNQLVGNMTVAFFFIGFFSSNLSSFDLVKGYWRDITLVNHEKRGYGTRGKMSPFISWYFVNAIRSHNYIGMRIKISNHRFNTILGDIMVGEYRGKIVNRIILYDDEVADPYWYVVKMTDQIPLPMDRNDYVLIKLRYQEDYVESEDDVEVFFKGITDAKLMKEVRPQKQAFPFYGWALVSMDKSPAEVVGPAPAAK